MIDRFRGPYNFLSNFYYSPFIDGNGLMWKTVEHYYQAQKAKDFYNKVNIMETETPSEAKKLGSKVSLRPDWTIAERVKVMKRALRMKFDQNRKIKQKLIDTHPEELVEGNDWGDIFWGQVNGKGQNFLGKLLMILRKDYIEDKEEEN